MGLAVLIVLARWFLAPRLTVVGGAHLERLTPPYLVAANHVDYLDGMVVAWVTRLFTRARTMFIAETANWRFSGSVIPVDKQAPAASIERSRAELAAGRLICLFVEGRRNTTATLLPGRTGAVRLSLATGVPIVPMGIVRPSGSSFHHSLRIFFGRTPTTVTIGEPFRVAAGSADDQAFVRAETDRLMRALAPLCNKTYL